MVRSLLAVVLLFAASASAQPNRWFDALAQVKQFLELTDSQVQAILANNEEYNRWSFEKQNRIRQVQAEIAEETAKEPLDPFALGLRYAEIEAICRQFKDRSAESRAKNIGIFTDAQKEKLKALEDAMKLAPVISEAQAGNLLGGLTAAPYALTSTSAVIGGSVIGGIIGGVNGCYLPFPTGIIRTGDFTTPPTGSMIPPSRMFGAAAQPAVNPIPHRWFDTTEFVVPPARPPKP